MGHEIVKESEKHPRSLLALVVAAALAGSGCADDRSDVGTDAPGGDGVAADGDVADGAQAPADASVGPAVLGGGSACDLVAIARQIAEDENTVAPVDCGVAVLTDPLPTWVSVSECLSTQLAGQTAFYGGFQLTNSQEPDVLAYAYAGIVGPPFVLKEVHYDSDPSAGWIPGTPPRAVLHQCVDSGVRADCTPTQGSICMGCFDQTRPDLVDLCPGW